MSDMYKEASIQTLPTLALFLIKMADEGKKDPLLTGTCVAAAAMAAGNVMGKLINPSGITGSQANDAMWKFIAQWAGEEGPMRLQRFYEILYPPFAAQFTHIPEFIWNKVKAKALKKLEQTIAEPELREWWKKIADGNIPEGIQVAKDFVFDPAPEKPDPVEPQTVVNPDGSEWKPPAKKQTFNE
jgi:hypothetical protein